ncbi:hypothetical protein GCM10028796_25650 [Ramlibacter monticola]|uniref:Uncharacterized protein n=1 Tax=Ramlibacter monticola TaxID=1926872 RepID=A0A936Z3W2_9BURK|nr:hypothetical protein [Ramlibacter monticola]MBL0393621.1 hypothetical protein [Ramlibacter monticola]
MRNILLWACVAAAPCWAQPSTEEMNAANNPPHPAVGVNLQDACTGRFYGRATATACRSSSCSSA